MLLVEVLHVRLLFLTIELFGFKGNKAAFGVL